MIRPTVPGIELKLKNPRTREEVVMQMLAKIIMVVMALVAVITLPSGVYLVFFAEPPVYDVGLFSMAVGAICALAFLPKPRRRR
jgi:hypothetical protein